jgi:hypothetical protein
MTKQKERPGRCPCENYDVCDVCDYQTSRSQQESSHCDHECVCGICDEWDASANEFLRVLKFKFSKERNLYPKFEEVAKAVIQNRGWLKEHDLVITAKAQEELLKEISPVLTSCAFYDEMISGEGGCVGNRNGERKCDGCPYFEIDGDQLQATIKSLRSEVKKP